MHDDIYLDVSTALRQAQTEAAHYLNQAYEILERNYEDWTVGDAIALSKVIAQDFHTTMMCMKMQEIRDAIRSK